MGGAKWISSTVRVGFQRVLVCPRLAVGTITKPIIVSPSHEPSFRVAFVEAPLPNMEARSGRLALSIKKTSRFSQVSQHCFPMNWSPFQHQKASFKTHLRYGAATAGSQLPSNGLVVGGSLGDKSKSKPPIQTQLRLT